MVILNIPFRGGHIDFSLQLPFPQSPFSKDYFLLRTWPILTRALLEIKYIHLRRFVLHFIFLISIYLQFYTSSTFRQKLMNINLTSFSVNCPRFWGPNPCLTYSSVCSVDFRSSCPWVCWILLILFGNLLMPFLRVSRSRFPSLLAALPLILKMLDLLYEFYIDNVFFYFSTFLLWALSLFSLHYLHSTILRHVVDFNCV